MNQERLLHRRPIPMGNGKHIFGGSFFDAPPPGQNGLMTINLMAEANLPCDARFPIKDYSVPSNQEQLAKLFEQMLESGKDVYVGCHGGIGRTGLFMASLLRYLGHEDPIGEVRRLHHPHAVETQEQADFVLNFPRRGFAPLVE